MGPSQVGQALDNLGHRVGVRPLRVLAQSENPVGGDRREPRPREAKEKPAHLCAFDVSSSWSLRREKHPREVGPKERTQIELGLVAFLGPTFLFLFGGLAVDDGGRAPLQETQR